MIICVSRMATFARTRFVVLVLAATSGGVCQSAIAQERQPIAEMIQGEVNAQFAPGDGTQNPVPDGGDGGDGDAGDAPGQQGNIVVAGNGQQNQQGNRADGDKAREASRRAFMEGRMRLLMARNGVASQTTQDAILEFLRKDEEGKQNVRDSGRNLRNGMRRDVPAERVRTLLNDYQKALQAQRDARLQAQTALDARVGYSLDPHLESLLWLLGVLGDGQNILNVQAPLPRRGWTAPITGLTVTSIFNKERQIDGIVNAKNRDGEVPAWLEIRDAQGQVWRASPQNEPNALVILSHQIQGLLVGDRVQVRVGPLRDGNGNTPLPLLAIIPVKKAGADNGGADTTPQ